MAHWWHHFLNDPVRSNPVSLAALIGGALVPVAWIVRLWWKTRAPRAVAPIDPADVAYVPVDDEYRH